MSDELHDLRMERDPKYAAIFGEFTPGERARIRVYLDLLPEPTGFVKATENGIEPL